MSRDEGLDALQKVGVGALRTGTPFLLYMIWEQLRLVVEKLDALSLAIARMNGH